MKFKFGDISKAEERMIIHGCNAQGVMGSGVAASIRSEFPGAYTLYKEAYDNNHLFLGGVIYFEDASDKTIGNCITQMYYGSDGKKYASYSAICLCLTNIADYCYNSGINRIATPWIGTGLGGLNKIFVNELFHEFETQNSGLELVVYDINRENV